VGLEGSGPPTVSRAKLCKKHRLLRGYKKLQVPASQLQNPSRPLIYSIFHISSSRRHPNAKRTRTAEGSRAGGAGAAGGGRMKSAASLTRKRR
jgi:hypothetical protein